MSLTRPVTSSSISNEQIIKQKLLSLNNMDDDLLISIVEAIIFASSEPVSAQSLFSTLQTVPLDRIQSSLDRLDGYYSQRRRGFTLNKVAGGYQFRTLPELAQWILKAKDERPTRLSRASLETLSIIAYNNPITRHKIEQIRGVESSGTIRSLLDKELILTMGRQDVPGRPILYGPSKKFLEVFGLKDFSELPSLPEVEQLEVEQLNNAGGQGEPPPEDEGQT